MEQHNTLISVISRRMGNINVILNYWKKNDITTAINALTMQQNQCDISVVMDFLNNSFAEGSRIDMLNFDNIAAILPHASDLMNGKYEPHIVAGLKTIRKILSHFGP
jgi:hypothetical protein